MNRIGLFLAIALVLLCGTNGCSRGDKGGEAEVYKGIEAEIRELNPDDPKQVDALKELIQERGWKQTRKIVALLHGEDEQMSQNAMGMIMELGDLALTPLLDASEEASPENRVIDLNQVVEVQLANRNRIVENLEVMLSDKTMLPPTMLPIGLEEAPLSRRVCDEAYLMMRLLFALDDEEAAFANKDAFLEMTEEERDQEIARAVKSQKWINLTETIVD